MSASRVAWAPSSSSPEAGLQDGHLLSTAPALLPDPGPCCLPPRRPFPSLSRQAQCLVLSGCRAPTFTPLRGLGALGSCPVIVPFLSCHQAPSAPGRAGRLE
uniref:Uncharacterized protein n=1 Tax=Sus scrofa TaxID=9823 RepID=A0A481DRH8_PIG